jgi:uridine kinase
MPPPQLALAPAGDRIVPLPAPVSLEDGVSLIVRAIELLRTSHPNGIFVAIAGPSGAGKSSIADRVKAAVPESLILSMDDFLDESRVIDDNFDDFRLIDFDALSDTLMDLQAGHEAQVPTYDFTRSRRSGFRTVKPPTNGLTLVEGTYALHASIRHFFHLTVSVSGGVHYDLVKRVMRDVKRTGQEPKDIMDQVTQTVYPMYKVFIEPDLLSADIRIMNKFNPFSSLSEAMYSLKTTANTEQLQAIVAKYPVKKVERYHDIYLHPPGTAPHECNEWIRLRNLNGRYSVLFSQVEPSMDAHSVTRRVEFSVSVKTLGGLMGLGYQIGAVLHRESSELAHPDPKIVLSIDKIEQFGPDLYVQVKGPDKTKVARTWKELFQTEDVAIPGSYVDLYMQMLQRNAGFVWSPGRDAEQKAKAARIAAAKSRQLARVLSSDEESNSSGYNF